MKLIDSYELEKAKTLYDKGKMIDFLPKIIPSSNHDLIVLDTWQQHFEALNIPYLIIETHLPNGCNHTKRRVFQLWKERRI